MAGDALWMRSPAIDGKMGSVTVVMPFHKLQCTCDPNVYVEAKPGAKFACCPECGHLYAIAQVSGR